MKKLKFSEILNALSREEAKKIVGGSDYCPVGKPCVNVIGASGYCFPDAAVGCFCQVPGYDFDSLDCTDIA